MKTITIIEKTVIKTGQSTSGTPWTLWDVTAVDEQGAPIEEKLKSFDDLHGTVQVEVERQDHEKFGTSYMLKLPGGSQGASPAPAGARLGPKVDAHEERIRALEERVSALEQRALPNTPSGRPYGAPPEGAAF